MARPVGTDRTGTPLIYLADEGDTIRLIARYPSQHFTSVHAKAYEIGAAIYKEMAKLPRGRHSSIGFGFRVDLDSPCTDDTFVLRWEMAAGEPSNFDVARRLAKMAEKMAKGLHRVSRGGGDIAWVTVPE